MEHYFIEKEHAQDEYFEISQKFLDKIFYFKSCNDVFSKNCVDYGSFVLINTIIKKENLQGKVLDIGCGYGVIGIVLADYFRNARYILSDINGTAIELSRQNIIKNKINNIDKVVKSFAYEDINEKFDYIVSNPPIKVGKETLLKILLGAYDHLNDNGKLIFVIKKKFGEKSIKKLLEEKFSSVEVINRDSGYYILSATK